MIMDEIKMVADTAFGIAVENICRKKLRELNSLVFDVVEASKEDAKIYEELLPDTKEDLQNELLSMVEQEFDIDKLSFKEGLFFNNSFLMVSRKYQNMIQQNDNSNPLDIIERIIKRRGENTQD